jgi:hypothetical protein
MRCDTDSRAAVAASRGTALSNSCADPTELKEVDHAQTTLQMLQLHSCEGGGRIAKQELLIARLERQRRVGLGSTG